MATLSERDGLSAAVTDGLARVLDHRRFGLPGDAGPWGWYGPHRPEPSDDGHAWIAVPFLDQTATTGPSIDLVGDGDGRSSGDDRGQEVSRRRPPGPDPARFGCLHAVLSALPADTAARVDRWRRLWSLVEIGGVLAVSFPVPALDAPYGELHRELLDGARGRLTLEDLVVHDAERSAGEAWVTTVTRVLGPRTGRQL